MFNFEKLEVWSRGMEIANLVYLITRNFPHEERFGLSSQMRRAAISISSNIAEGCSRSSRTDFARFIELATGSLFEIVSQATVGKQQALISEPDYQRVYRVCEELSKMLSGLRRSILGSKVPQLNVGFSTLNS